MALPGTTPPVYAVRESNLVHVSAIGAARPNGTLPEIERRTLAPDCRCERPTATLLEARDNLDNYGEAWPETPQRSLDDMRSPLLEARDNSATLHRLDRLKR